TLSIISKVLRVLECEDWSPLWAGDLSPSRAAADRALDAPALADQSASEKAATSRRTPRRLAPLWPLRLMVPRRAGRGAGLLGPNCLHHGRDLHIAMQFQPCRTYCLVALLFLTHFSWARGQTALLAPVADTSLFEAAPANNLGGLEELPAGTTDEGVLSRLLLK